jgi:hypothetical protein
MKIKLIIVISRTAQSQLETRTNPSFFSSIAPSALSSAHVAGFLISGQELSISLFPALSSHYLDCTHLPPQPRLHFSSSTSAPAIPHPKSDIPPSLHLTIRSLSRQAFISLSSLTNHLTFPKLLISYLAISHLSTVHRLTTFYTSRASTYKQYQNIFNYSQSWPIRGNSPMKK